MSRPPLVFATRRPPWPLDSGARIRAARLAQGLSGRFELTLVTFADGPAYDDTSASPDDLQALLPGARIELLPFDGRTPGVRRNAWRRSSASWGAYATSGLREALRCVLADSPDAVLHLDDPGVALAGVGLAPGRTAFAPHNIEHRILRDLAAAQSLPGRGFLELEWRKVAAEERRCWRLADVCVAVSDADAETMRAGGARRVVIGANGADEHEPLAPPARAQDDPLRLLFVGSGAFWPYARGLAWFAREVMPLLRAGGPVAFDVVGEPPPDPVRLEGVTYHGRVPDVVPFYATADALVVPVFEGSGTRLKIVEAAMLGRPVISTALGAEGLPIAPDREYVRAESPQEWVTAVGMLRRGELAPVAAAARDALRKLTWPRVADSLADVYVGLVSDHEHAVA
jgi:glycosyltransferase involved in cell wall biosynthesis